MLKRNAVAPLLTLLAVGGCDQNDAAYRAEIESLEARIESLEERVTSNHAEFIRFRLKRTLPVLLLQSDSGYSVLQNESGSLTLRWLNVAASGQGSKVTLQVGNLSSATITRLEFSGSWGEVDENGNPELNGAKDFEAATTQGIKPGIWNTISFVVDGAEPEKLGFLNIKSAEAARISLYGR